MIEYHRHMYLNRRRGIGLIEVVVGIAIFLTVVVSILGAYRFLVRFSGVTPQTVKAYYLLEEGVEAARILRDASWETFSGLTTGVPYYVVLSGNMWEATTTPVVVDGAFHRTMTLSEVYRDADDDIAPSGTLDPNTYFVTMSVSWVRGGVTATKTLSVYLANLFE